MFVTTLRLHLRNPLALLYAYLFPTLFLIAFWVLYRWEPVPLARHLGELLTVTVLGGACFGLPTALVSERERGVWRRYRLTPVSTGALVASTLAARYVLLLGAALLQLALAGALGMPRPLHPLDLWLAFTLVAFAFLGLGLVLAMLANTVPAVQALGQCLFLPLLIVGGVAVPLARLPEWAQQLASFFPGRYAVEALQAAVTGPGVGAVRFSLVALLAIGSAATLAGARLFRWDTQQRVTPAGYGWVAAALATWVAVGLVATARTPDRPRPTAPTLVEQVQPAPIPAPPPATPPSVLRTPSLSPAEQAAAKPRQEPKEPKEPVEPVEPKEPVEPEEPVEPVSSWRSVTLAHIDRDLRFDRLPPDDGVVTPIAAQSEEPDTDLANQLDFMATTFLQWKPAQVADPVQRVRNVLFVAAVPDVFQMEPLERYAPWVVFEYLQQNVPEEDLRKILYWIALHPMQGDDSAVDELRAFRLGNGPGDMEQTRERAAIYAVKLLGKVLGKR